MSYIGTQQDEELLTLIYGCKEGKRVAQEKLYKMMYPKMMSMVKRYTNMYQYHIAEEILNNGFLKVFQKIDSYKFVKISNNTSLKDRLKVGYVESYTTLFLIIYVKT